MSRALLTIQREADRRLAHQWIEQVPAGTRLEVKAAKRTTDQNSKLWAMLTDVAVQVVWHGKRLRPDDWKLVFLDALKRELRLVPNVNGDGFVNLGRSSSDLTKSEMSDLFEVIQAFGAEHGVVFHDPQERAA